MRANIPKGMGGGPQNMQSMIRQAQKMQEDMAAKQEELDPSFRRYARKNRSLFFRTYRLPVRIG